METKNFNDLKIKIEDKRRNLNVILLEGKESEDVLKFSHELDLLINEYYLLDDKTKVADN